MKVTDAKWFAGILDADGWFGKAGGSKSIQITQKDKKTIDHILQITGTGAVTEHKSKHGNYYRWTVSHSKSLNRILPHILPHMVIKGKLWTHIYETPIGDLVDIKSIRRTLVGPVKKKKHHSVAWLAGYIDGDGCLFMREYPDRVHPRMMLTFCIHESDRVALELIQKAYGSTIRYEGKKRPHIIHYHLNLGVKDRGRARRLLKGLIKHLVQKRWKAEQMLHYHNVSTRND